jgi:hypothetical protein
MLDVRFAIFLPLLVLFIMRMNKEDKKHIANGGNVDA